MNLEEFLRSKGKWRPVYKNDKGLKGTKETDEKFTNEQEPTLKKETLIEELRKLFEVRGTRQWRKGERRIVSGILQVIYK